MKNFYINAGDFDARREAETAEGAVRALFGAQATVSHVGTETTGEQVFNVEDGDDFYTVGVEEVTR